jgi:peptide/nickel transport system ATP-binding protein
MALMTRSTRAYISDSEKHMSDTLLAVKDLSVEFQTRNGVVRVLDDISFSLERGQTLGIVGESGCGKSITALALMQLIAQPPGRISSGEIRLQGENLLALSDTQMQKIRGNKMSMIFQEPMTSLNPAFTVGYQIAECVMLHEKQSKASAMARAVDMLTAVGIPAPEQRALEYPHQFSGGMRQRAMIAMALACKPDLLICDEPTTALDVTVQAQIFDLMAELRERTGTAMILITHDMGAIAEMADKVAVMYAGRIVEQGPVADVIENPLHPYTQGLIACAPGRRAVQPGEPLPEIPGTVPSPHDRDIGCSFAGRCPDVQERCKKSLPAMSYNTSKSTSVLCWLHAEGLPV